MHRKKLLYSFFKSPPSYLNFFSPTLLKQDHCSVPAMRKKVDVPEHIWNHSVCVVCGLQVSVNVCLCASVLICFSMSLMYK